MARRYLGYGTTNANGVATLEYAPDGTALSHSYTGVGAGKIDIVAESGDLQSSEYELIDAIVYDDYSTDTSSNYTVNSAHTVAVSNGKMTFTRGATTSSNFVDLRGLTGFTNTTITASAEVSCSNPNGQIRVRVAKNGSSFVGNGEYVTGSGTAIVEDVVLDADTNTINLRIEFSGLSEGDTVTFDNLMAYLS